MVLIVDRNNLPNEWLNNKIAKKISLFDLMEALSTYSWMLREYVEKDENSKQLIPYIVLKDKLNNRIGIYQRHGSEKRIHGLHSVGVGGHINDTDKEADALILETIFYSAKRELSEELIGLDMDAPLQFVGILNEEETKVGRTHFALLFVIELERLPHGGAELLNFHWKTKSEILANYKLELWSEMALSLI